MKPIDVKLGTCITFNKENNKKKSKFKVGDPVRIWKYKNNFGKGYVPNWPEEVFLITKVKNTVPWTYIVKDLDGGEIVGTFYEKKLQKIKKEDFRVENVTKENEINYVLNGKSAIVFLTVGVINRTV